MKRRKVAVTGGAGFIGSNLADELAVDNEVIIIDDLSTGSRENITQFLEKGNMTFIKGSITDLPLLRDVFKGLDFVFHHAAMASVPQSVLDPLQCDQRNARGTLTVLLAARDSGVKKVICASSCAVYGSTPDLPKTENMLPAPQSPYAVAKMAGEYYCQVFYELYRLPTVSLRYFNVYGPRQDPQSDYAAVIPRFITQALKRQPLTIYGDGNQTRDFVFVKDVVRANILAAYSTALGAYNIGSGQCITINLLAKTIGMAAGTQVQIAHQQPREGDIIHSCANIARAADFGYAPQYSLEAGLREMLESFSPH